MKGAEFLNPSKYLILNIGFAIWFQRYLVPAFCPIEKTFILILIISDLSTATNLKFCENMK